MRGRNQRPHLRFRVERGAEPRLPGAAAVLFLPYVRVSRAEGLSRPSTEIEYYSARLASYFSPSAQNFYFGERTSRWLHEEMGDSADRFLRPENSLFAGFLPTILFFIGIWAAWRGLHRTWRRWEGIPDRRRV